MSRFISPFSNIVLPNLSEPKPSSKHGQTKGSSNGASKGQQKETGEEKRTRVDSSVRRQALGWGRRGHSDGPSKVEQMMKNVPPVPRLPGVEASRQGYLRPALIQPDLKTNSKSKQGDSNVGGGGGAKVLGLASNKAGGAVREKENERGGSKGP
jgi:hypothetical protein